MLERTTRIGRAWALLSYYTDQLTTPCAKYFSCGSTLNGTHGGDRWARVHRGQIGWLSEPLHRVDADCSGCTNLKSNLMEKHAKKSAPPKTHHESHSSSATATTSRRRAKTHVPRVRPHSPASSIDAGFVCGNWPRTALAISKNDE